MLAVVPGGSALDWPIRGPQTARLNQLSRSLASHGEHPPDSPQTLGFAGAAGVFLGVERRAWDSNPRGRFRALAVFKPIAARRVHGSDPRLQSGLPRFDDTSSSRAYPAH